MVTERMLYPLCSNTGNSLAAAPALVLDEDVAGVERISLNCAMGESSPLIPIPRMEDNGFRQKAKVRWAILEGERELESPRSARNGFTFESLEIFWKGYWSRISVEAVEHFFKQARSLKGCNSSFIALSKSPGAKL
ncbi:hypothetical protein Tco_0848943 [Tanacetum coccineum]